MYHIFHWLESLNLVRLIDHIWIFVSNEWIYLSWSFSELLCRIIAHYLMLTLILQLKIYLDDEWLDAINTHKVFWLAVLKLDAWHNTVEHLF